MKMIDKTTLASILSLLIISATTKTLADERTANEVSNCSLEISLSGQITSQGISPKTVNILTKKGYRLTQNVENSVLKLNFNVFHELNRFTDVSIVRATLKFPNYQIEVIDKATTFGFDTSNTDREAIEGAAEQLPICQ